VSIINDDDETNKDDDVEDEFHAPPLSLSDLPSSMHAMSTSFKGQHDGSRQSSASDPTEDDESEAGEGRETVYYMPCNTSETDTTMDRLVRERG